MNEGDVVEKVFFCFFLEVVERKGGGGGRKTARPILQTRQAF